MPLDLTITFGGLCVLTDEPNADSPESGLLHVLMPHVAHGDHSPDPHPARLFYAKRYEPGADPADSTLQEVDLAGKLLDLSDLESSAGHEVDFPDALYNMDDAVPRRLSRDLLKGDGGGRLKSRAVVGRGVMDGYAPGGRWFMEGRGPRHMATSVRWSVPDVPVGEIEIQLKGLSGGAPGTPIRLAPVDGRIDLFVYHTTRDDTPDNHGRPRPEPRKGEKAPHFEAFYSLYDYPPVPKYSDAGNEPAAPEEGLRGSLFACIETRATLES